MKDTSKSNLQMVHGEVFVTITCIKGMQMSFVECWVILMGPSGIGDIIHLVMDQDEFCQVISTVLEMKIPYWSAVTEVGELKIVLTQVQFMNGQESLVRSKIEMHSRFRVSI